MIEHAEREAVIQGIRRQLVPVDGVELEIAVCGEAPTVLMLHGFTGSAASWADLQLALAPLHDSVAVTLLGHGSSSAPVAAERYRIERCTGDVLALMDELQLECPTVIGYSMGGRVALHLTLAAPERVNALVLESTSPGIADDHERKRRIKLDRDLALAIERNGVERFVEQWERQPLFASHAALPDSIRRQLREQRLASGPIGLANSLRGVGAGECPSLWERLPELAMPALLVAGELDEKYRGIALRMRERMPRARVALVEGAGHTVHLEAPTVFHRLVATFLAESAGSDLHQVNE